MLKGTLDDFSLPDVFRFLSRARKTGRLDVHRQAGSGRVFFRDGDIYYAEWELSKVPLGQKLIRAKVLTESQLLKALDEHAVSGARVGEILVGAGVISQEQLESAVRAQIEDAAFDLLRWELGAFEWEPGVEVEVEVPLAVSVENLIMESSRRLDELEVIARRIPSGATVPMMAPKPPEGAVEINITPDEWRVLVLVDGRRSVRDIADVANLAEFEAMRTLYGLASTGLIEVGEVADERAETVLEELVETDDAPEPAEARFGDVAEPALELVSDPEDAAPAAVSEAAVGEVGESGFDEPLAPAGVDGDDRAGEARFDEPLVPAGSGDDAPGPQQDELLESALDAALAESLDPAPGPGGPAHALDEAVPSAPEAGGRDWTEDPDVAPAVAPPGEQPPDEWFEDPQLPDPVTPPREDAPVGLEGSFQDLAAEPDEVALALEAPASPRPPAPAPAPASNGSASTASAAPAPPSAPSPETDRAAMVRELSGLFTEDERPRTRSEGTRRPAGPLTADGIKRVEDDEQVTKGLIARLIDGVKGL